MVLSIDRRNCAKADWYHCNCTISIQCMSSRPRSTPSLVFGQHVLQCLFIIVLILYFLTLFILSREKIEAFMSHLSQIQSPFQIFSIYIYFSLCDSFFFFPFSEDGVSRLYKCNLPFSTWSTWLHFLSLALDLSNL